MIIIEGLDATGKSTLANKLKAKLGWSIVFSEGPEKYPGEIIKRCLHYSKYPRSVIYDRHPIISQSVYSVFSNGTKIPPNFVSHLKAQKPTVVYATSDNKGEHKIKAHDTPEHLKMIEEKKLGLEVQYLRFLNEHFPDYIPYRFGDAEKLASDMYRNFYG